LPGVGVEYGVDWVIRELLDSHLTSANTLESFEQSIADCYPETVKIGWIEYDTATAIKTLDPVSWRIAHDEYIDGEIAPDNLFTVDGGNKPYWRHDVERFIEETRSLLS